MTPKEFKEIWMKNGESVSPISSEKLKEMKLKRETFDFLNLSGLPEDAAPFLTFATDSEDTNEGITFLTCQFEFLEAGYSKYIVIGADGSGNPIVINNENNDVIEWLDHEDYFSSRFMNSSVFKLAEFLVIYRDFIETIMEENGNDAYLKNNFSNEQFQALKERMMASDPKALIEDGFWKEELEMLISI